MIQLPDELIEDIRKSIEDLLIDLRDSRIGIINRGNGLVVRESDGSDSSIIRLGTPEAIKDTLTFLAGDPRGLVWMSDVLKEAGVFRNIAFVTDAGGGKLSAYVDRNLENYPPLNESLYVLELPAKDNG